MSGQRGQASLEAVAAIPALLLAALIGFQLLVTAYSAHLADGAAEAGALAVAAGRSAEGAALAALPGWARGRIEVSESSGRVGVSVRPPGPFAPVADALTVESAAWARPADD